MCCRNIFYRIKYSKNYVFIVYRRKRSLKKYKKFELRLRHTTVKGRMYNVSP